MFRAQMLAEQSPILSVVSGRFFSAGAASFAAFPSGSVPESSTIFVAFAIDEGGMGINPLRPRGGPERASGAEWTHENGVATRLRSGVRMGRSSRIES